MSIVVTVPVGTPPVELPATVRALFTPVTDPSGHVIDWKADPRAVAGRIASGDDTLTRIAEVVSLWKWERVVGDHDTLVGMVARYETIDGAQPIGTLRQIISSLATGTEWAGGSLAARGLFDDIEAVRQAFATSNQRGLGIYAPGQRGILWAGTSSGAAHVLVETAGGSISATDKALTLQRGGQHHQIGGWIVEGDGGLRFIVGGASDVDRALRLELGDEVVVEPTDPLCGAVHAVAPGAHVVRVALFSLPALYARALTSLRDAAEVAFERGSDLRVHTQNGVPTAHMTHIPEEHQVRD